MQRRVFLQTLALGASAAFLSRGVLADELAPSSEADGKKWFNMENQPIEGRAWLGEERRSPYDRFPTRWMDKATPAVQGNATHSAGMAVRFKTNADHIFIRYELTSANLAMYHMPSTGVSGFDLYGRDSEGTFRFIQIAQKGAKAETEITAGLSGNVEREYLIYLPLYNGVKSLEIGVPTENSFELIQHPKKPMLFYGTSIVHGGCASRPGMPHPALLARRLEMPHWNFGFSGSARRESELAEAFGELDPSVYILDCLPNMKPEWVKERFYNFVVKLRESRPDTPIVLVEDRRFPNSWVDKEKSAFHDEQHRVHKAEYERLLKDGVKGLFYVEGDKLLPPDGNGTVDNSHPTDYGFIWQANVMEPVLREALGMEKA